MFKVTPFQFGGVGWLVVTNVKSKSNNFTIYTTKSFYLPQLSITDDLANG